MPAYHGFESEWKAQLLSGLREDGWPWDWTALGTLGRGADRVVRARVVAKSDGVWAADPLVVATNACAGEDVVRMKVKDGARLKPGQVVCEWKGPARLVLALERPFLNLASYAGGIATQTARIVEAARRACPKDTPRITATRKTMPGYKDISLHAVRAGGGFSHRVNLAGGVLIKENHVAAAGGIRRAIEGARATAPHSLRIEVEVRDERELQQALDAGAEIVMLDNFTPAEARAALKRIDAYTGRARARPIVEVSGGIGEGNVADYAFKGVDVISIGSITHSVRAIDLSLLVSAK